MRRTFYHHGHHRHKEREAHEVARKGYEPELAKVGFENMVLLVKMWWEV